MSFTYGQRGARHGGVSSYTPSLPGCFFPASRDPENTEQENREGRPPFSGTLRRSPPGCGAAAFCYPGAGARPPRTQAAPSRRVSSPAPPPAPHCPRIPAAGQHSPLPAHPCCRTSFPVPAEPCSRRAPPAAPALTVPRGAHGSALAVAPGEGAGARRRLRPPPAGAAAGSPPPAPPRSGAGPPGTAPQPGAPGQLSHPATARPPQLRARSANSAGAAAGRAPEIRSSPALQSPVAPSHKAEAVCCHLLGAFHLTSK